MPGKAKLKLDGAAVKQFFIDHVEKVGLALGGLVLLYLVYGAFGHETQERTPSDLSSVAAQSRGLYTNDNSPPETEVPAYAPTVEKLRAEIAVADFATPNVICPPLSAIGSLREQPEVLTVVDLQTAYGYGPIKLAKEAPPAVEGGKPRSIEGRLWVVVTGLVPTKAQYQAFDETFRNAQHRDKNLDTPKWIWYTIERAVVDPAHPTSEPKWEPLHLASELKNAKDRWAGGGDQKELIDASLIEPAMVFPLPPLEGRPWDETTTHARLPLKKPEDVPAAPAVPEEMAPEAAVVPAPADPAADGPLADGPPVEAPKGPAETKPNKPVAAKEEIPEFKLFRFFDFNVQPNTSYRYRVQVWLANPNNPDLVQQRFVAPDVWAKGGKWITSDFSEPSAVVTVGGLGAVYLSGPVRPGSGLREPYLAMIAEQFLIPDGLMATANMLNIYRGAAINRPGVSAQVVEPNARGGKVSTQTVNIATDHFLVDVQSDEKGNHARALMLGSDLKPYVLEQLPPESPVFARAKPPADGEAVPEEEGGGGFDALLNPGGTSSEDKNKR